MFVFFKVLHGLGAPIPGTSVWLRDCEDGMRCISMSRGGVTFHSTDIGSMHLSGTIEYCGRADRVRKRFGQSFSLDNLEMVVCESVQGVELCRVELLDDLTIAWFVQLFFCLFFVFHSFTSRSCAKASPGIQHKVLRRSIQAVLPRFSVVLIVESLPLTEHGKLDGAQCRELCKLRLLQSRGSFVDRPKLLHDWLTRRLRGIEATDTTLLQQLRSIDVHCLYNEFARRANVAPEVSLNVFLFTPVSQLEAECLRIAKENAQS
jgi:hypothetical protein